MPEDGLFLGSGRIFTQGPHAPERVAAYKVVGVEFDDGRSNHIEEFLNMDILWRNSLGFCFSLHSFIFLSGSDLKQKNRHVS
jgi:hypothetical protein